MPLHSLQNANAGIANTQNSGTVIFPMATDNDQQIWIHVTEEALQAISPTLPSLVGGVENIGRFKSFRNRFEEAASTKYEAGIIETDGTIKITEKDIGD